MSDATPSKRAALKTILKKMAKLIPHFTNTNDGEALNALRAATRLLASVQLDWHDLTALLVGEPQSVLDLLMTLLGAKDVDLLLHLAREKATFFHTAGGDVYATIDSEIYPSLQQREEFTIGYGTHPSPRKSALPPLRP